MYTKREKDIIRYVKERVKKLFADFSVPGHGIDHLERVARMSKLIAMKEKANSVFLCELAGWFHDIGRVPEHNGADHGRSHWELSYEMLRGWFKEPGFPKFSVKEKRELLYAVRNHWTDVANKYDTAQVLRDADKIDCLGHDGLRRWIESFPDEKKLVQNLRLTFQMHHDLRTKTAKNIVDKKQMMRPIIRHIQKIMRKQMKPIKL